MPSKPLKPLYIAKTFEDLKKKAEDVNQKISMTSKTSIVK